MTMHLHYAAEYRLPTFHLPERWEPIHPLREFCNTSTKQAGGDPLSRFQRRKHRAYLMPSSPRTLDVVRYQIAGDEGLPDFTRGAVESWIPGPTGEVAPRDLFPLSQQNLPDRKVIGPDAHTYLVRGKVIGDPLDWCGRVGEVARLRVSVSRLLDSCPSRRPDDLPDRMDAHAVGVDDGRGGMRFPLAEQIDQWPLPRRFQVSERVWDVLHVARDNPNTPATRHLAYGPALYRVSALRTGDEMSVGAQRLYCSCDN